MDEIKNKELTKLKKDLNLYPSQEAVVDFFFEQFEKNIREEIIEEIEKCIHENRLKIERPDRYVLDNIINKLTK